MYLKEHEPPPPEAARNLTWLRAQSHEWADAWVRLADLLLAQLQRGTLSYNDADGTSWLYLHTYQDHAGSWWHRFEHPNHPNTGRAETICLRASRQWTAYQHNHGGVGA
jgi:hypothetical protein